jgi:hypothetical protein
MKFRVLSIDTRADDNGDGEGDYISWSWNSWHPVEVFDESIYGELNEENALKFFFVEMFTAHTHTKSKDESFEDFKKLYEVEDDQFNIVLKKTENQMPIYGIEYGNKC